MKPPKRSVVNLRDRLQETLLREPGYISLSIRWLAWLAALGIVAMRAGPPENLLGGPLALLVSGSQLLFLTLNPAWLRFQVGRPQWTKGTVVRPLADITIALGCVYLTGGWNSPFYHFAITTVLAPALRYGMIGAMSSALVFTFGYTMTVWLTPEGFSPAYSVDGHPGADLVSTPLNPLMIGLFAAFLGEILHKLQSERQRAEELAAAEERARLARDIHDGVAQTLFMLTMSLESGLVMAQKEGATTTAEHLKILTPVAQKALLELRNAMHNIEPLATGRQTLGQAVGQLVRDYQSATGCHLVFSERETFQQPGERSSGLFRMIQESLANACHHSGAELIEVILGSPSDCGVTVSDNGKGFDPGTVRRGRGLSNLKERAEELGMNLVIVGANPGTKVEITW